MVYYITINTMTGGVWQPYSIKYTMTSIDGRQDEFNATNWGSIQQLTKTQRIISVAGLTSNFLKIGYTLYPDLGGGSSDSISFTPPTPANGARNNSAEGAIFNATCTSLGNITFYFDTNYPPTTLLLTQYNKTNLNWTSNVTVDGTYYYFMNCSTSAGMYTTGVRSWMFDDSSPWDTFNANNFYTASNGTSITDYSKGAANLTINKSYVANYWLYGIEYYINQSDNGASKMWYKNETLGYSNISRYNFTWSLNFTGWIRGKNYTITEYASEIHTDKEIPDYQFTTISTKGLDIKTDKIDSIKYYCDDDLLMIPTKIKDRYVFDMEFTDQSKKDRDCYVESNEKIQYYSNSDYPAHLIISNQPLYYGSWFDAVTTTNVPVVVTKVSDKKFKITFKNTDARISTKSIGGMNLFSSTHRWFLPDYPAYLAYTAQPSNVSNSQQINFTSYWNTTIPISKCYLETNYSGVWANYTISPITGTTTCYSLFTVSNTSNYGTFSWRVYANSTYNLWNVTPFGVVKIVHSAPTMTPVLQSPLVDGQDAVVSLTYADADTDTNTTWATKWYKNTAYLPGLDNLSTISYTNYTVADVITVSAMVWDTFNISVWTNASETVIGNFTNATYAENSFYGQTNPFNITFTQNDWTYFLPVPRYVYVTNLDLYLTGFSNNISCYQESANISNQTGIDGRCGQSYIGNYTLAGAATISNKGNSIDGNWDTYTQAHNSIFHTDYDIRITYILNSTINISNSFWKVKDVNGTTTFSLNSSLLSGANNNILRFRIFLQDITNNTYYSYFNGSDSDIAIVTHNFSDRFFEEAINFTYQNIYSTNPTLNLTNQTQWSYSGVFSTVATVDVNKTLMNNILETGCTCTNCSIVGNNCHMPFTFHSDTAGILTVGITAFNYTFGLDNCTNSFSIPSNVTALNYSGRYEGNNSEAFIDFTGIFSYVPYGGGTRVTSYPSINNYDHYTMCVYPAWGQFTVNYSINYNLHGSTVIRTRAESEITASSSKQTIPLYVLSDADGAVIRVRVVDPYANSLNGVNIVAQRDIAGITYTVQTAVTDSSGMAYFFLSTSNQYTLTASKTGYATYSATITPSALDTYTITLYTSGTSQTLSNWNGIFYQFYPKDAMMFANHPYTFTFMINSSVYNITGCESWLGRNNSDILEFVPATFNERYCIASLSYTYNGTGLFIHTANVQLDYIYNITVGPPFTYFNQSYVSNFTIKTIVDDINNFTGAGFDWKTRMILGFILILAIVFWISYKFQLSVMYNPEIMIGLIIGLVWLVSYMGFFSMSEFTDASFAGGLLFSTMPKYVVAWLVSLLGGAYIIWRRTQG